VFFTNNSGIRENADIAAAVIIIGLNDQPSFQKSKRTIREPIIAPEVSIAWCMPNPLPRSFVVSAIIASLGGSRIFPNLSSETSATTECQEFVKARSNLNIIEIKYPKNTKLLRFPVLSENQPPNNFIKLESPSLNQLINPTARPAPPKDIIRNGSIGVIISLPISFKKLDPPSKNMFLSPLFINYRRKQSL